MNSDYTPPDRKKLTEDPPATMSGISVSIGRLQGTVDSIKESLDDVKKSQAASESRLTETALENKESQLHLQSRVTALELWKARFGGIVSTVAVIASFVGGLVVLLVDWLLKGSSSP